MARPVRPKSSGPTKPTEPIEMRAAQVETLSVVNGPEMGSSLQIGEKQPLHSAALKRQNLEYISFMLRELRSMAICADERSLVYFLEMAALEAGERAENLAD